MRCVREGEKQAGPCWGEVACYSFDIDLPTLDLCKGHVLDMFTGADRVTKAQVAEELEGLDG